MAHVVTADMIVVRNEDGQQVYLNKGVQLPDYVSKETLKDLQSAGLIDQVTKSRSKPASSTPVAPEPFDPAKHNQDEVLAYLGDAKPDEVERVKAAEAADGGKQRKSVADFTAATGD